jgi:hypothetical protein
LQQLRALDTAHTVFGSALYQYRLGARADRTFVEKVESAIGGPLPAEYRMWITELSDGGAGPCYGLRSLADACEDMALDKDFPFTVDAPCETDVDAPDEAQDAKEEAIRRGGLRLSHHQS